MIQCSNIVLSLLCIQGELGRGELSTVTSYKWQRVLGNGIGYWWRKYIPRVNNMFIYEHTWWDLWHTLVLYKYWSHINPNWNGKIKCHDPHTGRKFSLDFIWTKFIADLGKSRRSRQYQEMHDTELTKWQVFITEVTHHTVS